MAKTWWETIQAIDDPKEKVDSLKEYYRYIGGEPKGITDELEIEDSSADILSIVGGNEGKDN